MSKLKFILLFAYFVATLCCIWLPSVLWHCWLVVT